MSIQKYRNVKYFKIVSWTVVITAVLPLLRAASLAVFKADDFNYSVPFFTRTQSLPVYAFNITRHYWRTMNGAYVCNYLTYMFDPLNWYSYRLLRLILLGLILLSVIGLYLCLRKFTEHFSVGISPVYSFALMLLPLIFYREYHEVYLWFCGAMGYLLPTIGAEYGIFFLLKWDHKKKWGYFLLAILSLVFMSGCNLEITGFGMWLLLVIIVLDYIYNGRLNKGFAAAFFIALGFALMNVAAPGYYKRAGAVNGESLNLLGAALYSLKACWLELVWLHSNASFPLFEILAFILGATMGPGEKKKGVLSVFSFGLIMLPVITVYPVILGYGYKDNDIENRCLFMFDAALIICCIGLCLLAGYMNCNKLMAEKEKNCTALKILCPLLVLAILVPSVLDGNAQCMPAKIAENLIEDKVMTTSYLQKRLYEEIRDSDSDDVVIESLPKRYEGNTLIEIDEDKGHFINVALSEYFGKKSVVYNPPGD